MKKIIFTILTSAVLLTSCDKFLTVTPQDAQVAENYYTSEAAVKASTLTLYASKTWFDFHAQFMWMAGDMLSGDLYYTYDQEGHFYYNKVTSTNPYMTYGWQGLYSIISFANSIINDMPAAAQSNGVAESIITQALAEARFIRGTAYIYLAEYWGAVPIIENSTAMISANDILAYRNTQADVYRFLCTDLEYAAENLAATNDNYRVTKWGAEGMLARAYLLRAAYHVKLGDGQAAGFYEKAKQYAGDVLTNSRLSLASDYSTLFDVTGNNNSESLFAIQCMKGEYAAGSTRNVNWSRSSRIADQTWGAGKGPTRSLQSLFLIKNEETGKIEDNDLRRKWIFMTEVNDVPDHYDMLAKEDGGYDYQYVYMEDPSTGTEQESMISTLAHVKKYVIGRASDCGDNVGLNQDAGNNIYILRLADVYMMYVEACIGENSSTSDVQAIGYLNQVLSRAGYQWTKADISFEELINERRKEFALEGLNWLAIKRMYYRDAAAGLKYLNDMERDKTYAVDWTELGKLTTNEEKYAFKITKACYVDSWETLSDTEDNTSRTNPPTFTDASMFCPIPESVVTQDPLISEEPVPYYDETNE